MLNWKVKKYFQCYGLTQFSRTKQNKRESSLDFLTCFQSVFLNFFVSCRNRFTSSEFLKVFLCACVNEMLLQENSPKYCVEPVLISDKIFRRKGIQKKVLLKVWYTLTSSKVKTKLCFSLHLLKNCCQRGLRCC